MMAKIVKGRGFAGAVKYILDPTKEAKLIDSEGVRLKDNNSIIHSFVTQSGMNPRVSKPVCHISLSFSAQDREQLTDAVMEKIAREYMEKMGITNTQYIVGRHYDKEHPHCHIIFNRVDNEGKTISDSNDRFRSEKICKELTEKHGLYFATGKENVKEHRLKEPGKTRYEVHNVLKDAVPKCRNWNELKSQLLRSGITTEFKTKGATDQIEGVKFAKNGYQFNGSKVDRQFSYSKIDFQLSQNNQEQVLRATPEPHQQSIVSTIASGIGDAFGAAGSLLGGLTDLPPAEQQELNPYKKKKKKPRKGIKR